MGRLQLAIAILILAAVVAIYVYIALQTLPYRVTIDPIVGYNAAGQRYTAAILNITNTGRDIPHLVVRVRSYSTWRPGNVSSAVAAAGTFERSGVVVQPSQHQAHHLIYARPALAEWAWDFGPLHHRDEAHVTIRLRQDNRCCFSLSALSYGNLTASGMPDPSSVLPGGRQIVQSGGTPVPGMAP